MHFLTQNATDPYFNMAFDEFCLESLDFPEPVFYLWQNAPAVIIGLNQSAYAEVNLPYLQEKGIQLVRRVTGGGAVYHDLGNLNYTIMGRSADLQADYPGYLLYMRDALRALGVPVSVSGRNDILLDGRKCSGYAKRVYKDRLMVHGTLMYDVDLEEMTRALNVPGSKMAAGGIASVRSKVVNLKDSLPGLPDLAAFRSRLQDMLRQGDAEVFLTAEQLSAVADLAQTKFRRWEWNLGRSPKTDFSESRRFPCGTVTVSYSVVKGCLADVSVGGDFIGDLPAEPLVKSLDGCPFRRADLRERLAEAARRGIGVERCFDALSPEDFLSLFPSLS